MTPVGLGVAALLPAALGRRAMRPLWRGLLADADTVLPAAMRPALGNAPEAIGGS